MFNSVADERCTNFMTIDEIRALQDPPLEPLPNGQGNIVLGLEKLQAKQAAGFFTHQSDAHLLPNTLQMEQLKNNLQEVLTNVKHGNVTRDEALEAAKTVIGEYRDAAEQNAMTHLEHLTGVHLAEMPPEAKILRDEEINYYVNWFTKTLDDVLKQKG